MRTLPPPLAAAIASGTTTLARAWTVTRTDGQRLGFTDHDRPLAFDGVTHEALSGANASTVEQATGLSVDSHTLEGALISAAISDEDLERGLYDGAAIRFWLVDWRDPETRFLLAEGRIGEVRRGEHAFEAEVVGLSEALNQPHGRAFLCQCDRRLGDDVCGVDLSDPAYRGSGAVSALIAPEHLIVTGLSGIASGWFARGLLTWQSGENQGQTAHVKAHRSIGQETRLELWHRPSRPVAPGDAFTLVAGCDKTAETCRAKFSNILNFRGFPHMPGDDYVARYPNTGEAHDGGSLFRG
ncbi:MAG: DUF2163 domain-containing protein [Paracoccaceae bacterium]